MWCTSAQPASARRLETRWRFHLSRCPDFGVHFWRHLNGLSLGMMGDPVRCLPKVVHPDVAALKLQHKQAE